MTIKALYSEKKSVNEVVEDLKNQSQDISPKLVIYFASSSFDQETLASQIKNIYGNAESFGCSTSGEIVSGQILKNSVVAMLFSEESITDVKIEILENISQDFQTKEAFKHLEEHFRQDTSSMDFREYLGLVLIDGLSCSEEKIMDQIGNLTNVLFVGGSAGDDLQFKKTYVYANGKSYTNAAILALLKPVKGFEILKTQSFKSLNKKLIATKVDEPNRTVIEFNNKPAVEAYAEAIGVPKDDVPKHLMTYPVGLMHDGEPFVRSPQQIKDSKIVFYCNIKENTELDLLESTDIVKDTADAVKKGLSELGEISGIINFHCILRTLELEAKNLGKAYGEIFKDIPTIGFSTYGEQFVCHINQTSVLVLFK